jgi:hypothetical protein
MYRASGEGGDTVEGELDGGYFDSINDGHGVSTVLFEVTQKASEFLGTLLLSGLPISHRPVVEPLACFNTEVTRLE